MEWPISFEYYESAFDFQLGGLVVETLVGIVIYNNERHVYCLLTTLVVRG